MTNSYLEHGKKTRDEDKMADKGEDEDNLKEKVDILNYRLIRTGMVVSPLYCTSTERNRKSRWQHIINTKIK